MYVYGRSKNIPPFKSKDFHFTLVTGSGKIYNYGAY